MLGFMVACATLSLLGFLLPRRLAA
jgi:hypothetical protein